MAMNDLVSNFLTRIRNGIMAKHDTVQGIPCSKVVENTARVLKEEGYINDYRVSEVGVKKTISVDLKYRNGESVITKIERASKPGRRVYESAAEVRYVKAGLGIAVVTTSRGVMTDRKAREMNVGGEIVCRVW